MFANIHADILRLGDGRLNLRILVRGLLSQGFQAITVYRFFRWLYCRRIPSQPLRFIAERFIEITCGISIPVSCNIGPGLRIHHFGGIIFHPSARIGKNCTIYQGVTVGDKGGAGNAARIGDDVLIGAGAKIIGEIEVGSNVIIGANVVVTENVPDNSIVVGSPTRILKKENISLEQSNPEPVRVMDFRGTYKGGGGPDKTILNSAAQHDSSLVNVRVVYIRQPDDHEFKIPAMAAELCIQYEDVIDSRLFDFRCFSILSKIVSKNRIQVLHTHDDKTLLYGWLLKVRHPQLFLLHTCHSHANYGPEAFKTKTSWLTWRLRKSFLIFLMKMHHRPILTISENTKQRLVQGGLKSKDVQVMANGIDVECWHKEKAIPVLRNELGLSEGEFLVGTVARITYDKDMETFYLVAKEVVHRVPQARFVIVGDGYGNELAEARQQVEEMGLSGVINFTGHRTDLLNVYASFNLFLMTSRTEGMPNTILEAMAMEVPVVSTAVGGVPELVKGGVCGTLCRCGDVESLADAVVELLINPQLRQVYSTGARRHVVHHFNFARRVKKLEEFYRDFSTREAGQSKALLVI